MSRIRRNVDLIAKHGLGLLRPRERTRTEPSEPASRAKQPRPAPKPISSKRPKLPSLSGFPSCPNFRRWPAILDRSVGAPRSSAACVIAGLLGMGWRSWSIAVERNAEYEAQGNRQQLRTYTLAASRGNIVDRQPHLARGQRSTRAHRHQPALDSSSTTSRTRRSNPC